MQNEKINPKTMIIIFLANLLGLYLINLLKKKEKNE